MDAKRLYKEIEEMIYKDANRAEKMLFDAASKKFLSNNDIVNLTIALGAQLWVKDKLPKARNILNIALEKAENNDYKAEAYKYLALIFYDEGSYKESMKLNKQVLSLTTDKYLIACAYKGIADVLYELNKKEESLEYYFKSLDYFDANRSNLWGDIELSLERIIHIYLYLGNKTKADIYIDKILKEPKSSSWALYSTYYELGHYYYRRRNWGHALENYKLALSHFDKKDQDVLGDIYDYIGSCYHQLWELKDAKINYQKSLEYTREEDKERLKQRKEALKIINEAIARESD